MLETFLVFLMVLSIAILILRWRKRILRRRETLRSAISAEALHRLLATPDKPSVIDLRVPLDFLVHPEIIPGARRIAPSEIIANPDILSREVEYVLYCTCPGVESREIVLAEAVRLGFSNVRLLTGGIEAWKQKGFPVEPYNKAFQLDVPEELR